MIPVTINDPVSQGRLTKGTAINAKLKLKQELIIFCIELSI